MGDQIEFISDGEGAVVIGSKKTVRNFLKQHDLIQQVQHFNIQRLAKNLRLGSNLLESISTIAEQSSVYLKLTPESVERLKAAGGLMPTDTKGISYAMLGKPGDTSMKWIQVSSRFSSNITNPAVLAGIGGLMTMVAQQAEAQELREFFIKIENKLDDIRIDQRNAILARMQTAAGQIEDAKALRDNGGDPKTLWDKVQGAHASIFNVQEETLLALSSVVDKAQAQDTPRGLKKATAGIEKEVAMHLSILARCFELDNQFQAIELDHVMVTSPNHLEGHRRGLTQSRENRRNKVLAKTQYLMQELDRAGAIANENILLHATAARRIIDSLNSTAVTIDEFHTTLGISPKRDEVSIVSWREAWQDPNQRKNAMRDAQTIAGTVALVGAAVIFNYLDRNYLGETKE